MATKCLTSPGLAVNTQLKHAGYPVHSHARIALAAMRLCSVHSRE